MKTVEERFWEKVDIRGPDECWEWVAAISKNGYGAFGFHGKIEGAHRVSFILSKGDIPKGVKVCHSCDNPLCCNPKHLWPGTQSENMIDCSAKGRLAKIRMCGPENHSSKLNIEKAREIRRLRSENTSLGVLSKKFGVSKPTIVSLLKGLTWREEDAV